MAARLRVGFASAFFHVGTAGRYFRSWLTDLDRERFDVRVYHLYPGQDEIAAEIKGRADRFVEFGGSRARPSVVAPVIRDDALDVLVYPELGMDHTSFALAALRLAPGNSPPGAIRSRAVTDDRRVHHLRRHGTAPTQRRITSSRCCAFRASARATGVRSLPERVGRARIGLPEDRVLLLCPQSLFKVHPDNDELFARILADNPAGDARDVRRPARERDRRVSCVGWRAHSSARHVDPTSG